MELDFCFILRLSHASPDMTIRCHHLVPGPAVLGIKSSDEPARGAGVPRSKLQCVNKVL